MIHLRAKLLGFVHPHLLSYRSFLAFLIAALYSVLGVFLILLLAITWHFLSFLHADLPRAFNQLIFQVWQFAVLRYQGKFSALCWLLFFLEWQEKLIKPLIPLMLFLADSRTARELLQIIELPIMLYILWRECISKVLLTFLLADVFNFLDQVLKLFLILLFIASIGWQLIFVVSIFFVIEHCLFCFLNVLLLNHGLLYINIIVFICKALVSVKDRLLRGIAAKHSFRLPLLTNSSLRLLTWLFFSLSWRLILSFNSILRLLCKLLICLY